MNYYILEILFCKIIFKYFWKYIKVYIFVNIVLYICIFDIYMVYWLYSISSSSCRYEMFIWYKNCVFYSLGFNVVKIVEFFFFVIVKIFR